MIRTFFVMLGCVNDVDAIYQVFINILPRYLVCSTRWKQLKEVIYYFCNAKGSRLMTNNHWEIGN